MILHQQKFVNPWDLEYGRQCENAMYKISVLPDDASYRASSSDNVYFQQNAPGSETQFDNEEKMYCKNVPRQRIFSEYGVEFNNEIQHNINGLYLQDQFGISFEPFHPAVPSYAAFKKKAIKPLWGLVNRSCLRAVVDKI
jgi:hypothetical protein